MELPKLLLLLFCIHYSYASYHSDGDGTYIIPLEGYNSELQDLGEHVEVPEQPVKVVKITKTVAVKIPVPYPVKVREKVPYPVHVAKPYPVPVPQIIKVPHSDESSHAHGDQGFNSGNGDHGFSSGNGDQHGPSYNVQEGGSSHGHSESISQEYPSEGYSYDAPIHSYNGGGNYGAQHSDDYDTSSYDKAIQEYQLQKQKLGHNGGAGGYNYH